jgi:hypothetical protein
LIDSVWRLELSHSLTFDSAEGRKRGISVKKDKSAMMKPQDIAAYLTGAPIIANKHGNEPYTFE